LFSLHLFLPIGHASQSNADRFRIGWERRRTEKRDIASPSGDQNLGFLSRYFLEEANMKRYQD